MKNYVCPNCESINVFTDKRGTQTGLYCKDCGRWIKWLSLKEIRLLERAQDENKEPNMPKEVQLLQDICKPVSDYLKENYDPHTTIIITDSIIKLVKDEIGIPIKR
jgi:hypothetical protein